MQRVQAIGTYYKVITLVCLLTFLALISHPDNLPSPHLSGGDIKIINSNGEEIVFDIEIASTEKQRQKGLMNRRILPDEEGMLFVFDDPQEVAMWMKDTYLPLDMIFINEYWHIANIAKNTTPHSEKTHASDGKVVAVLEINAMLADKYSIEPGNKVEYGRAREQEK